MQLNGLMFTLDTVSMLWVNFFCLDLYRSLEQFKAIYKLETSGKQDEHVDVRLDGFGLKVLFMVFTALAWKYGTRGWWQLRMRRKNISQPPVSRLAPSGVNSFL